MTKRAWAVGPHHARKPSNGDSSSISAIGLRHRQVRSFCRKHAVRPNLPHVLGCRAPVWQRPSSGRPRTVELRQKARGVCVARWYDPGTGQFVSVDPELAETDQPYAYAGDDPVNGSDPSGLDCTSSAKWQWNGQSVSQTLSPDLARKAPGPGILIVDTQYEDPPLDLLVFRVQVNGLLTVYPGGYTGQMSVCAYAHTPSGSDDQGCLYYSPSTFSRGYKERYGIRTFRGYNDSFRTNQIQIYVPPEEIETVNVSLFRDSKRVAFAPFTGEAQYFFMP
jgi:hypothetical protein